MTRLLLILCCLAVAGCASSTPRVNGNGSISENGESSASVGVSSGRVHAGVGTEGAYAGADVVQTERVSAGVSTGGAYARADVAEAGPIDIDAGVSTSGASTSVGLGRVRVGYGVGGWRIGF